MTGNLKIFPFLFFSLLIPIISTDSCTFNVHYVTQSSSFPTNCSQIIGRFRIDENSQMSNDQLLTLFKNVREIRGVLQIWNTQLTSVTFTRNIQNITGDPLDKAISVLNNTKMINLNISSLSKSNGKIEIRDNLNLNLQKMCSVIHNVFFNRRYIRENSFDCGCEIDGIFKWPAVENFPTNCIVLYGNLALEGNAPPFEVLYRLSTVTNVFGFVQIRFTNLESLGFLQNLEEIESGIDAVYTLNIENNQYLQRLDLVKLRSIKSRNPESDVQLNQNSGLCLDPAFLQLLAQSSIRNILSFTSMEFCELDKVNNPSIYCTGSLTTINERCTRYIGDIVYFNPDVWSDYDQIQNYTKIPDSELKKIQQLETIFGSIYIQGTRLTNFTLPNLQEIYQIAEVTMGNDRLTRYAIVLKRNDFLLDVSFPNLKIAYSWIQFRANANLTMDDNFCRKISKDLRRAIVGLNSDYDCRPYMTPITPDGS